MRTVALADQFFKRAATQCFSFGFERPDALAELVE
jgi:hypothetical protein